MSGNLIGIPRVGKFNPTEVRITGAKNTVLLDKMIRTMRRDADRIAEHWAARMAEYARQGAPSSGRSRAAGRDSNNPHNTELRENIYHRRLEAGRYVVGADLGKAPWGIFVITGVRRHVITARAHGAAGNSRRALRQRGILNRRADRVGSGVSRTGKRRDLGLSPRFYNKKHVSVGGQVSYLPAERKLSAKEQRTRAKRQQRVAELEGQASRAGELAASEHRRQQSGSINLVFRWSKGASRWGGRLQAGLFVGPRVTKLATKPNDFITRARGRIGSPFAADIRRLLEGRYP